VNDFDAQCGQIEFADQIGGFGYEEVILDGQCFMQRCNAHLFWLLAERVEDGDLLVEFALAGAWVAV
jgi:hypothetical protein